MTESRYPRRDAKEAGQTVYLSEKPCCKCDTFQRYTVNGACLQCMRDRRSTFQAAEVVTRNRELTKERVRKLRAKRRKAEADYSSVLN